MSYEGAGWVQANGGQQTFGDLAEDWFAIEQERLVEPANERRHIDHLRSLWDLKEAELGPKVVKAALVGLLKPKGPLSAVTVNKVRGTGRRIIRSAQEDEVWHNPNPFDVVRRFREAKPVHRTLSLDEVRAVLPHLREDRRREALTMLYIGCRPGELKALRREDVDLHSGIITIRRSNDRSETKTGRERQIPIPVPFRPILEDALSASPPDCPLVFPTPQHHCRLQRADAKLSRMLGDALRHAGLVTDYTYSCRRKGCGHREAHRKRADRVCPRCGFKLWESGNPIHVRWYDLRHSSATLHREAGCDPLVIQLALGHTPENTTDSLYTHLSVEYMRRELSKLTI